MLAGARILKLGQKGRGGTRRTAGRGILGKAGGAGMKHARLQIERLLRRRHLAGVEIDGIGSDRRKGLPERRCIGLCPPDRLARFRKEAR